MGTRAVRDDGPSPCGRRGRATAGLAVHRSGWVLVDAVLLLGLTAFASRWVDRKFFPVADRATVVVELEMPEGTHLDATDEVAARVERALRRHPRVESVGTFVGRNGPKFYYNLLTQPESPHRAMLVAETETISDVDEVVAWARRWATREAPEAVMVARRLEQGSPIPAPIQVRVMGHDLEDMERVADELQARAVHAERLPKLQAGLTYFRSDGDPLRPEDQASATVGLTWTPFAAGTRAPRRAEREAEAGALHAELEELERGVEIQLREARSRVEIARDALRVRQRGVDLAEETLRVERERHAAGRATTNDLLDAEAELRRQRMAKELARLDLLRSWIVWDLASGAWDL